MRKVALAIAASLVLAVVAPAFSQPFADVPTDHWAFDAIAELAAKGIVEGYPDGTFKGDRAMTRYEMAMVVARILARVEAIKIPAPPPPTKVPPPEVGRADIVTLQRLVNEFRAELAALGVRVTAMEEELAALRDRLDNVRVSGDVRFRYSLFPQGSPSSGTGIPSAQFRNRTTFRGSITRNITAVARITTAPSPTSSQFTFGSAPGTTVIAGTTSPVLSSNFETVRFDQAYLDLGGIFGVNWRLGRQPYTLAGIGASGYGLLFDPGNGNGPAVITGMTDGLKGNLAFGGFPLEFGVFRHSSGLDIWAAKASLGLIPGWSFNFSAISQRRNSSGAGLGYAGATAGTSDFGFSADVMGNLLPGVGFGAAFANFSPGTAAVVSSTAWTAWATINLGQLTGMTQFAPSLSVWYKNYGTGNPGIGPLYSGAVTETFASYPWNFRGWGLNLGLTLSSRLSADLFYETGNTIGAQAAGDAISPAAAAGAAVTEWFAALNYSLASRTTVSFRFFRQTVAGADTDNFYRIQLTYSY